MHVRAQNKIEKLHMTIGSTAIAVIVSLISIAAAVLGWAQMA